MSVRDDYQLLDFGDGRHLERFGEIVLDRPCPAAESFQRSVPDLWKGADARFEGREQQRGQWVDRRELPDCWVVTFGPLQFELKRTEFGHLGLFPEQAENWDWIAERCRLSASRANRAIAAGPASSNCLAAAGTAACDAAMADVPSAAKRPLRVLNLFAYTGGSTLAAAAAGAEVVHVDAAKNIVAWARRNAELSGLTAAPVRWIVEDAMKFVKRELKRGNRYDAVVLDPPSYGHGPHGEVWRLAKHLPRLLDLCAELTGGRPRFMLLTCHTPGYDAESLRSMLQERFQGESHGRIDAGLITLCTTDGRTLPSGTVLRLAPALVPGGTVEHSRDHAPGTSAGAKRRVEH
jgi:23S rRNA (cytosine1962-C5)-methyltransferase